MGSTGDDDASHGAVASACTAVDLPGGPCGRPAVVESRLSLCRTHLLAAHDWAQREYGTTDLLPGPCPACGSRLGVSYPSGWLCAVCEWRYGDLPDALQTAVRVDVVYYIRFADRIKIGTTANPRSRIAALPHHEVLAFERGDRTLERARHEQFGGHRIGGSEWFHMHDELTTHIGVLGAGSIDPWRQYARWMSERLALGR